MPTLKQWEETDWFQAKPQIIKDLFRQFPYASSVRIRQTNQKAYTYSWFEDGTVSVVICPDENPNIKNAFGVFPYRVFGYKPEDLILIAHNDDMIFPDDDE